jgi:exodeoxyribonuclease VII large subunit
LETHLQPSAQIYSVDKLTREIKNLLENRFDIVWISGEISNLRVPSSGHAYFTLKDHKAQISAVMFRGQLKNLKFDLDDGANIVGMGRISVYEPRGNYQIILEYIEPKGVGALQIAFEQLKRKLNDEGLFDQGRKRKLPYLPLKIGLITSPSGSVIQDILKIVYRRFPNLSVDIFPVAVQGQRAADEIANAIRLANTKADSDVLILARGGGSLEDLSAFNTEIVARAIYHSNIPIISAVGHETDFTIADFVADVRSPTPSAAAGIVVPFKEDLEARCTELKQRSLNSILNIIERLRKDIVYTRGRLVHPQKRIQELQLRLDDVQNRLLNSLANHQKWRYQRLGNLTKFLLKIKPDSYISESHSKLDILEFKLKKIIEKYLSELNQNVSFFTAGLNALNPLAVLDRGYSITRTLPPKPHVVASSKEVKVDQPLEIILKNGSINVRVTEKRS